MGFAISVTFRLAKFSAPHSFSIPLMLYTNLKCGSDERYKLAPTTRSYDQYTIVCIQKQGAYVYSRQLEKESTQSALLKY